jgi:hypothetical protein
MSDAPKPETGENLTDFLEEHVTYANEGLSWNDLMFLRMERSIKRLAESWEEPKAEIDWLNRHIK